MGPCCRFGSWSACSCTACPGLRDDFSDPVDTWPKAVETLTATAARIAKYFDTIVPPVFSAAIAATKSEDCNSIAVNMHLLLCIERKVSTLSGGAMARLLAHRVFDLGFGLLDLSLTLPLRLSATAARIRSFKAASSILSPSWMSMARLTFPSRLELNKPEGSFN